MRQYTTLFSLIAGFSSIYAIPADPTPKEVVQPDGTVITVTIRGDEYGNALYNENGERIIFNKNTSFFEKAPDNAPTHKFLKRSPRKIRMRNDFPTIGKQKSLVVLMEFSDVQFSSMDNPHEYYDRMLNEEGFTYPTGANGSARDFYLKSSDGQFDPTFVVAGPARLSKEATYYGADTNLQDCHMGEAIKEALDQLDEEIDFSEYDTNGDGLVDNIFFFYAGNGQADTPDGSDLIWPHSAFTEVAWGIHLEYDGVTIGNYACSNEIRYSSTGKVEPTGIGTFVHEFGHVLGLADHYDTGYNIMAFGLGSWDTMAQGSYNNNMHTPPLFSMFEKAELGWAGYTEFSETSHEGITSLKWLGDESKGLCVRVPGNENEWFVLENRQKEGWDKYLPGHGLLIWHIDMDEDAWLSNKVNTDPLHQRIDIVEVDGVGSDRTRDGDVMPGAANVTSYDLRAWDGSVVLRIDDVTEDPDGVITILPKGNSFRLNSPEIIVNCVEDELFSFSWSEVADASRYFVSVRNNGEYITGYDRIEFDAASIVSVTGLLPDSEYSIEVVAARGSYYSEPSTELVTTTELMFSKRKPANPEISVADNGFVITYLPLAGAEDHLLNICNISREETASEKGYDFSGKDDGMPEMWESSSVSFNSVDGYYGDSSPSLRLSKDDSYLTVAWPETVIDKISLWQRAKGAGGEIIIEIPSEDGWSEIDSFMASSEGETIACDVPSAEAVRIRFAREGGYIVIDDVKAECRSLTRNPIEYYSDASIGVSGEFTVMDLPSGTYGVTLHGVNEGVKSRPSDEIIVSIGGSKVEAIVGTPVPVRYYNTLGYVSDRPFRGINIVEYSDGSRKKIIR